MDHSNNRTRWGKAVRKSNEDCVLKVEGLSKTFEGYSVLDDVHFCVNKGEVVGLLGPNGAGKTTAFYSVIGLIPLDTGKIFFKSQEIQKLSSSERARLGIGFLSQEPSIFRDLSVENNLNAVLDFFPLSSRERQDKVQSLLEEFDLWEHRKRGARVLSGGQRRRLEIARALCLNPDLILLDEPFANVDPITIEGIKAMIAKLTSRGLSILITDHNAREIFSIADYCYLLSQGSLLAEGSPKTLSSSDLVRERYLGSQFNW